MVRLGDEIICKKSKKVVKNLLEGVGIWTPVTHEMFIINPN